MKVSGFLVVIVFMIEGAQATTCDVSHQGCKQLSMSLNPADTSQCNECASQCLSAKRECVTENNMEKLRSASGHHLNCKNSCAQRVAALSKK